MRRRILCSWCLVVLAVSCGWARLSPEVERLLENHLRARGGLKAYQQIKTRRTVALVRVAGMAVTAVTLEFVPDGKSYQTVDHPTMGKTEVGFDGQRVWQRSVAMQGVLSYEDPRARAIRRGGRAAEFWDYKKDDRTFEYGGKVKYEGADYEALLTTFTDPIGKDLPAKYYFDSAGMLRLIVAGQDASTRLEFSDYRAVDGIQYAFRTKTVSPMATLEIEVQEIKHNVGLDYSIFQYKETEQKKP